MTFSQHDRHEWTEGCACTNGKPSKLLGLSLTLTPLSFNTYLCYYTAKLIVFPSADLLNSTGRQETTHRPRRGAYVEPVFRL